MRKWTILKKATMQNVLLDFMEFELPQVFSSILPRHCTRSMGLLIVIFSLRYTSSQKLDVLRPVAFFQINRVLTCKSMTA